MAPFDWHELATKKDLEQVATKAELNGLGTELRGEMNDLGTALRTEMNDLGTELRAEMNGGFAQLRQEMEGLRRDVRLTLIAVLGFMLSVVLAAAGAGITLAA